MPERVIEFEAWLNQCIKDAKLKLGCTAEEISFILSLAIAKEMLRLDHAGGMK